MRNYTRNRRTDLHLCLFSSPFLVLLPSLISGSDLEHDPIVGSLSSFFMRLSPTKGRVTPPEGKIKEFLRYQQFASMHLSGFML